MARLQNKLVTPDKAKNDLVKTAQKTAKAQLLNRKFTGETLLIICSTHSNLLRHNCSVVLPKRLLRCANQSRALARSLPSKSGQRTSVK